MAYGDKKFRRGKLPNEYGVGDFSGLGVAGAVGILSASLLDLIQRGESSALFMFNRWVVQITQLLGMGPIPLYVVVLLLMAFGALSVFYFQPVTAQGAFAQGFGLLAGLMTVAPSHLGAPMTGQIPAPPSSEAAVSASPQPVGVVLPIGPVGNLMPHTAAGGGLLVAQAGAARTGQQNVYDVTLSITLENGLKKDVNQMLRSGALRGRIYISETKKSYDLFRNSRGTVKYSNNILHIRGIVPGLPSETGCFVRLEIDGYKIEIFENQFEANRTYSWDITMTPTKTPLLVQRLTSSYWF